MVLLPLSQRLPGLLLLLLCLVAVVLLVFTSRFSPLQRSKRLIFVLGVLAIAMEILWHGALILAPSLGRWLTFPHVAIWLLFLLTAMVRKVLTLSREPIVTASVVLGPASGYSTLGIAGGILLTALCVVDPLSFNAAVGTGVLNPANVTAQVLATRLGITGHLYVAILIGLILGRAQRRQP